MADRTQMLSTVLQPVASLPSNDGEEQKSSCRLAAAVDLFAVNPHTLHRHLQIVDCNVCGWMMNDCQVLFRAVPKHCLSQGLETCSLHGEVYSLHSKVYTCLAWTPLATETPLMALL